MLEVLLATAVISIYDGDTMRVNNQSFRMVGIDAPEIHSKCVAEHRLALIARDYLRTMAKAPGAKLIETQCYGSNFGRKCGYLEVNGINALPQMVSARLADSYHCGSSGCPKRRQWCQP